MGAILLGLFEGKVGTILENHRLCWWLKFGGGSENRIRPVGFLEIPANRDHFARLSENIHEMKAAVDLFP